MNFPLHNLIAISSCIFLCACGDDVIENAVKSKLNDPASAQFQNIKSCGDSQEIFQGEVNSKNLMGGYVGFKPFYYDQGRVYFIESPDVIGEIDKCSNLNISQIQGSIKR